MALLLGGCEFSPDYGPAGGGKVDFVSEVKPVLELHCLECHNRKYAAKMGGLRLETRKLAMTTGTHGPVIVPGDVRSSLLYKNLRLSHATPTAMPPKPDKLKRGEKQIIARWIREGAHWPEGAQGRLSPPPEEKEKPKEPEKSEKKEKKKEDPAVTPDPLTRVPVLRAGTH